VTWRARSDWSISEDLEDHLQVVLVQRRLEPASSNIFKDFESENISLYLKIALKLNFFFIESRGTLGKARIIQLSLTFETLSVMRNVNIAVPKKRENISILKNVHFDIVNY